MPTRTRRILLGLALGLPLAGGCRRHPVPAEASETGPRAPGGAPARMGARERRDALLAAWGSRDPKPGGHRRGETLLGADRADPALLAAGRRTYREGLSLSGAPVTARVAGDAAASGAQFSCSSCHRRSGLGSTEGDVVAPMVTGRALYEERTAGPAPRPAYSDETLGRVIREGIDPAGRRLDPLMPRYQLAGPDLEALIAYLKQLSSSPSPGVTEEEIHFATVLTDGPRAREVTAILEHFFRDKNNDLRNPLGRRRAGPFHRRHVNEAYRKWRLHRWVLEGPEATWRAQLDSFHREQPVFALLSGTVSGSWEPIHEFCEEHEIPCILPATHLPAPAAGDGNTVYFSGGLLLEARAVAADACREPLDGPVLQVFRSGSPVAVAARELERRLLAARCAAVFHLELPEGRAAAVREQAEAIEAGVLVLWLGRPALDELAPWLASLRPEVRIYLSSSLLAEGLRDLPEGLRGRCVLVHPYCLEDEFEARFARVSTWLAGKGIKAADRRLAAQTYFACLLAGEALMHVRFDYYYRDFFLETIDHTTSRLARFCASHPAPTFGPGQRYLQKGCYLLAPGRQAEWIVP